MSLMQPKILYFTKYSRNAGSSRLRSYQYIPYLEKAGFQVEVSPLFSETYLKALYAGKPTKRQALAGYAKRLVKIFTVGSYDRVVIEKELFPFLPAFAERFFHFFGIKYIVDYDDAVFHHYDRSSNPVVRTILVKKIDAVMKYSACVVAGNTYLAERARSAGAKRIEIIPTVIDLARYPVRQKEAGGTPFVVGWIGTKTTFEKHLLPCREWLKQLQLEDPGLRVHIVGITSDMDLGPRVQYIPWTEETEVSEILKMDVGLMPLQDSPWEKGKCAYKLIQYSACGIPGIASDVGMNREVTVPGETGILATTDEEWMQAVRTLKNNAEERLRMGQHARKKVEALYSIQQTWRRWEEILNNAG